MRIEGQQILAPQAHADISDGNITLQGLHRIGYGTWAINLHGDIPPNARFRLNEQLVIEGLDLPAGNLLYGRKLYLRNSTPVVLKLQHLGTVEGDAVPAPLELKVEKEPKVKKASKP